MVRLSSFLEVINEFYREPYYPSLEKQLDPFSRGGGVPVFLREPIGTCGFPDGVGGGGGGHSALHSESVHALWMISCNCE